MTPYMRQNDVIQNRSAYRYIPINESKYTTGYNNSQVFYDMSVSLAAYVNAG